MIALSAPGEADSTRNKMLAGLTEAMQRTLIPGAPQLIAMPDWGIEQFTSACTNAGSENYNVDGAMIVRVLSVSYWVTHKTFQEAPTTAIDADALYATCNPGGTISYAWHDDAEYKDGTVGITNLSSLSLLIPAIALYQGFIPSKTRQTVTTEAFLRPTPLPSGSQVTTVSSSYSPSASGNSATLTTALLTSALGYTQLLTSTPPPINDRSTWTVVNHLSKQIAADTKCPTPSPAPGAKPLPTALPDARTAPFCQTR